MDKTITVNNIRVRNLMSYHYLLLLLLTVFTEKITDATSSNLCQLSSHQTLFQDVTFLQGSSSDEIKMMYSIPDANSYDANIYICLSENNQSVSEPCLWEKLEKVEQSCDDSTWTVVVKFFEDIDCSYCLVKWKLTQKNSNTQEYVGCTRVMNPRSLNLLSDGSGYTSSDTTTTETTSITFTEVLTTVSTTEVLSTCRPVGKYKTTLGMKQWCIINCAAGHCPATHCTCSNDNTFTCEVTNPYKMVMGMKEWCITNCLAGYCPPSHCNCS